MMTWQRVDENTYIDNTLVNCAEYQLFIDEMREQGKFYQPNHWTSYSFPIGYAKKPLLGVSYTDAVAFCEWLTKKEGKERILFRLPSQEETRTFPMAIIEISPLGYWIAGDEKFLLMKSPSSSTEKYYSLDITIDNYFNNAYYGKTVLVGCIVRALTSVLNSFLPPNSKDIIHDLEHDLVQAQDLYNNSQDIDRASVHELARASIHDLARFRELSRNLDLSIVRDLDISLYDIFYPGAMFMYNDMIALQERLAGHSPAFEGIRLVKERTH